MNEISFLTVLLMAGLLLLVSLLIKYDVVERILNLLSFFKFKKKGSVKKSTTTTPQNTSPTGDSGSTDSSFKGKFRYVLEELTTTHMKGMEGIYFGPVQTQAARPFIALFLAIIFTCLIIYPLLLLISSVLNAIFQELFVIKTNNIPWEFYVSLVAFLSYHFWKDDSNPPIRLDINEVAILSLFGRFYGAYLRNGNYPWIMKKLWIDINTKPLDNTPLKTELEGKIYIGIQTFKVWNDTIDKIPVISVTTLNNSMVFLTVTIEFKLFAPITWMQSEDPRNAIGESIRSFIRELIPNMIDSDIPLLRSVLTNIFNGDKYIFAFTLRSDKTYPKHKLVTDRSGKILSHKINPSRSLDENLLTFEELLKDRADETLLRLTTDKKDKINTSIIEVEKDIISLLRRLGANLENISVSDVKLSDEVLKAAKKAASEILERDAQITSANTIQMVSKILQEAGFSPSDAAHVAAIIDGTDIDMIKLSDSDTFDKNQLGAVAGIIHNAIQRKKGSSEE